MSLSNSISICLCHLFLWIHFVLYHNVYKLLFIFMVGHRKIHRFMDSMVPSYVDGDFLLSLLTPYLLLHHFHFFIFT